ncbi:hypothetical protein A6D98_04015 [Aliivibrio fischeri]|uniref:retron Eco8 family effector endonuclease n=1 Tax=Aliivibrio fischeri TaxID=668 RepID=UPI00080DC57E|nr:retron Eco8 family effector endonuclease [Aliivibrio fischeri]OCH62916.1 hypothetical protein A6D98_04015 [Aliivibrio fischeri]
MAIKSIRIKNLLSFDDFSLSDIKDINCIVGRNNVGKTNLLNIIDYFYSKLDNEVVVPPSLFSNYSPIGTITITYDTTKIKQVVSSNKNKSDYQKYIYRSLFKSEHEDSFGYLMRKSKIKQNKYQYTLTLTINKNGAIYWSDNDPNVRSIIKRVFPFYSVNTRKLDLYDWSKLWNIVSQLKFLKATNLNKNEHVDYIDSKISPKSGSYRDYIEKITSITKTSPYDYQELILNYIKVGLDGHTFNIDGQNLDSQSDGTNSHKYLELFLSLMIALTRREYIYPTVYVDEPEIGLHPKRNEKLIKDLHDIYDSYKSRSVEKEIGKYKTPNPTIIFSTHSPNIVKMVIKLFNSADEHKIIQFSMANGSTNLKTINSYYNDKRFLNVFSDNEARLFFSQYILFVEGETELEIFGNSRLSDKFPKIRNIDIYRTNEVMLKAINPTNSNLAIPYLILYDADKMISIDHTNGAIHFKSREVNLFELKETLRFSIFGSERYKSNKSIDGVLYHHEKPKDLIESKASFKIFKYNKFIDRVNKITVSKSNKYITSTTIEGSLINENSLILLIKWILFEFKNNTHIGGKGDVIRRTSGLIRAFENNGNVRSTYLGIHAKPIFRGELLVEHKKFSVNIKRRYIKSVLEELKSKNYTKEELITIFRLLFEGKTDTLISTSNKGYENLSSELRSSVDIFRDNYLKNFPCSFSKTGGWVTSFLDYSIMYMERMEAKDEKNSFLSQFRFYYPELYDIISHVSNSIE